MKETQATNNRHISHIGTTFVNKTIKLLCEKLWLENYTVYCFTVKKPRSHIERYFEMQPKTFKWNLSKKLFSLNDTCDVFLFRAKTAND